MTFPRDRLASLADWLGLDLTGDQLDRLVAYADWLRDEAMVAGGIGPAERDRLFDRHVGDSLTYLAALGAPTEATSTEPVHVVDVGAGVGLPGIPLAIARPDARVTLLDRSGRRVDLARRAIRVVGIHNAATVSGDVRTSDLTGDVAVFRASLDITAAAAVLDAIVGTGGLGVFGVSRSASPPDLPDLADIEVELIEVAPPMLDSPAWLLRMRSRAA